MKTAFCWGLVVCCLFGAGVSHALGQVGTLEVKIAAVNGNRIDDISCTTAAQCPGNSDCVGSFCTLPSLLSAPSGDTIVAGDTFTFEIFGKEWGIPNTGKCFGTNPQISCTVSPDSCPSNFPVCMGSGSPCPTGDIDCGNVLDSCINSFCIEGPLLKAFQFAPDLNSFTSGDVGSFSPAQISCTMASDCFQGFNDPNQCSCVAGAFCDTMGTGTCGLDAVSFIAGARSDYVFNISGNIDGFFGRFTDLTLFGVGQAFSVAYDNVPKYLGTWVFDSSADAKGEFAIAINPDPLSVILGDVNVVNLPTPNVVSAIVEFPADVCQGVVCPPASNECQIAVCMDVGGTPVCSIENLPFGTTCIDEGNLCTIDICSAGVCTHNQMFCPVFREVCDPADGVCKAPPTGCVDIVSSDPPNCAIDARQPHGINNVNPPFGWDSIDLDFDMACDASTLTAGDFTVDVVPGNDSPPIPMITGVSGVGNTATVMFNGPIPPKNYTCITHNASGVQVCLGYMPGDVEGGGVANVSDVTALVDDLNLVTNRPLYQTDIDRGGVSNSSDLTRLIDLLNGANQFAPFNQVGIGVACPSLVP